jgi:hypothetical protein
MAIQAPSRTAGSGRIDIGGLGPFGPCAGESSDVVSALGRIYRKIDAKKDRRGAAMLPERLGRVDHHARGLQVVSDEGESDRRTGYYVASHDWPAISNDIPIQDIYTALDGISDEAVAVAMKSLRDVKSPVDTEPSSGC